jgi:hypothetical protein
LTPVRLGKMKGKILGDEYGGNIMYSFMKIEK